MFKFMVKLKVDKYLKDNRTIRLDLGAGPFRRKGWIGIDFDKSSEIVWDLTQGIPFPDNSVDVIHSEHFFEHLSYPDQTKPLLIDCYRVLKPKGKLSFSVPDIGKIIQAYSKGEKYFWKYRQWWQPHSWITTPMDVINWYGLMSGEHKFMYDSVTTKKILREAGFKRVSIRKFDHRLDYNKRESSIYTQGYK